MSWEHVVAKEYQYHKSCYKEYTRIRKTGNEVENLQHIDEILTMVKELIIEKNEILSSKELVERYESLTEGEKKDPRCIINAVISNFDGEVGEFTPKYGCTFLLMMNNNDQPNLYNCDRKLSYIVSKERSLFH